MNITRDLVPTKRAARHATVYRVSPRLSPPLPASCPQPKDGTLHGACALVFIRTASSPRSLACQWRGGSCRCSAGIAQSARFSMLLTPQPSSRFVPRKLSLFFVLHDQNFTLFPTGPWPPPEALLPGGLARSTETVTFWATASICCHYNARPYADDVLGSEGSVL